MDNPEKIKERTDEYQQRFANPFVAASLGFIDDVIMPHSTRFKIASALRTLKKKKLSNPMEEAR